MCSAAMHSSGTRGRLTNGASCTLSFTLSDAEVGVFYLGLLAVSCRSCGACMVWLWQCIWCGRWCGFVHVVQCSWLVTWAMQSWWQVMWSLLLQTCIVSFRYVPAFPNLPTSSSGMSTYIAEVNHNVSCDYPNWLAHTHTKLIESSVNIYISWAAI